MNIFIVFGITFTYVFFFFLNFVSNVNTLPYEAIFNFGDSISDTGNVAFDYPSNDTHIAYGSMYFNHPSGRLSNGRLIIDFIGNFTHIVFSYLNQFVLYSRNINCEIFMQSNIIYFILL